MKRLLPRSRRPKPQRQPSSPRRIAASRANGALSKGPRTAEGKRIASANSLRHGLLAEGTVLPTEERGEFEVMQQECNERYAPRDKAEQNCVDHILSCNWRIRRVRFLEVCAMDEEIARQTVGDETQRAWNAFRSLGRKGHLDLLRRYELGLFHIQSRAGRDLEILQTSQSRKLCEEKAE